MEGEEEGGESDVFGFVDVAGEHVFDGAGEVIECLVVAILYVFEQVGVEHFVPFDGPCVGKVGWVPGFEGGQDHAGKGEKGQADADNCPGGGVGYKGRDSDDAGEGYHQPAGLKQGGGFAVEVVAGLDGIGVGAVEMGHYYLFLDGQAVSVWCFVLCRLVVCHEVISSKGIVYAYRQKT